MRAPDRTFKLARLRKEMSLPEAVLWRALRRDQQQGLRFRRQHPVGSFVLDFYCASARLAIEVDGAAHDFVERAIRDEGRDAWLAERGIRVLRFLAKDVLSEEGLEMVLLMIADVALAPPPLRGSPPPLTQGRIRARMKPLLPDPPPQAEEDRSGDDHGQARGRRGQRRRFRGSVGAAP